ncbi:unnamed protein product [Paramecium pentaurelia]|uniref:Protein kinase domain-containing protein n=1 Tax=Paramecium pentaurelia TaxID=43138 RepID=A0A8S1VWN4_9CILI|nr:unnamed protein product [Paramecium pentaurelia]
MINEQPNQKIQKIPKQDQYPQLQQPVQNQAKPFIQNNPIEGQIINQFPQFILPLQNKTQQPNPIIQKITIEGDTYEKFQQPIGQGSQSIVYKGRNIKTQEIVAIKEYKLINQNELKAIQAIQRNNFSHIIGIKGVQIQQNSYPIIAMEFAHGDFLQFMQSQEYQKLTYNERNSYFIQMVQGVEQLHSIQLFHRDLKPENFVYIKDSNNKMTIKLIDFGLVKETKNQMKKTIQAGTEYYMAPEVFDSQNGFYDKSVDTWSLGIILYEILAQENLFKDKPKKNFSQIKQNGQNFIDERIQYNDKIQQKEKYLIKKMLKINSSERIQLKDVLGAQTNNPIPLPLPQKKPQDISEYNFIIDRIPDQQRKEQEQKLKKEKDQYESLFIIVKQQSSQQSLQIKTISEQIKYYQRIKLQFQGEVKIQDVIQQQQIITQDIQVLEQQERMIQQFDQLQLISLYQQYNSKLEELQQSQNRLKILIEEANECLKQIERQYEDEYQQQIDDLDHKLNEQLDKFKYLSKNQKYKDKINQIINKIADESGKLNSLNVLISQRTQVAYQQYNQNYDQIQQSISDFQKQYNQLHEQIYNDEQIQQKNGERIKKLKITQDQLDLFKKIMNQLKEKLKSLINNQYCNDEQIMNLINNRLGRIEQTIIEQQKQFDKFNEINEQNSCEIINYQINQLEEFQRKLKEVENNVKEQVDQLKQIIQKIGAQNKSEQEKEILKLNNQLQNMYKEFSKALQSIKFKSESIEFYQKVNEKKEKLEKQLQEEIKNLEEYLEIQNQNTQLFNEVLNDIKAKKEDQKQQIEEIFIKLQQTNKQKGDRLKIVANKVFEKQIEINFTQIDDNLIQNYEQLKIQEEQLQIELNKINDKIWNQQLNPQQLNELKDYILKVYSNIDELKMKIPQYDDVQQHNQNYQQNLESYEKLYALLNYIKQYHLTRYYERINEDENKWKYYKKNNKENDYKKLFQSRLNEDLEKNAKIEMEAQDILQRYEYALNESYYKMAIESMEKDQEEIEKQIQIVENLIKSRDLIKLRSKLKDQSVVKEIINVKQYYKIIEFAQMLIFNMIKNKNKQTIQQGQINQY